MNINEKLQNKLTEYNIEFDKLMNDSSMRDACFTSCGCGNRATQKRITAYRNKIGTLGNKIEALKFALKIVNQETFVYNDIIKAYNYFLQLRNPELYYTICNRCFTFDDMTYIFRLIIELFLPIGKNQVLNSNIKYDNENGNIFTISLSK